MTFSACIRMPCTCSSPLLSWKCGLRVSICSTGTELAITSGLGALQHAAELLEQIQIFVRLDRETAGQPQLQAEVEGHRVLARVAGGDHLGAEAGVLGEESVEPLVGDLRAAALAAEEQPAVAQLGLGVPGDPDHRVRRVGQVQPGRVRLAVLVDRARARSCRRPRSRRSAGRSSRPGPCRSASPRPCRARTRPPSSISSGMPAALNAPATPGSRWCTVIAERPASRQNCSTVCASIS